METTFEHWLATKKITDVISSSPQTSVTTLDANVSVEAGLQILSERKILSAPILDETGKYLGLVDMFDLVTFVLSQYVEQNFIKIKWAGEETTSVWRTWCQDINKLEKKGQKFATVPIGKCINISLINPFVSLSEQAPLSHLLLIFRKGIHRVVVIDETDKPTHIVSQSNVIRFLAKNIHRFGKIAQSNLDQIGLGKGPIITVSERTEAIQAFHIMQTQKVSAVGIVDHQGILIANLSISDLRGLSPSHFDSLLLPVMEYLGQTNPDFQSPPYTSTPMTTFETVILKLAATGAHRLFNIDEWGKPVGVVSLTDVMNLLDLRVYVSQVEKLPDLELSSKSDKTLSPVGDELL